MKRQEEKETKEKKSCDIAAFVKREKFFRFKKLGVKNKSVILNCVSSITTLM